MRMALSRKIIVLCVILSVFLCSGCDAYPSTLASRKSNNASEAIENIVPAQRPKIELDTIPPFAGEPYCVINNNVPFFSEDEHTTESFEHYSELDALGRCQVVYACLGRDLMPTKERGSISSIKPTGWHSNAPAEYNRTHLIGFQLADENANKKNLITGTRYMNVNGMLPFENMVADYIKETDNHVLFRVTPIFQGKNLVASGVQMEAKSVEDNGDGILFNIYIYNIAPGKTIDYETGESYTGAPIREAKTLEGKIRGNSKSKIYHCPGQASYKEMLKSNHLVVFNTEEEAIKAGYRKAKN